jgi:hypothetical protein
VLSIRKLVIDTVNVGTEEVTWEIPQGACYIDIAVRPTSESDVFVRMATEEGETQDEGLYRSLYPETANWTPWNFKTPPYTYLYFKATTPVILEILIGI